MMNTTAAAGAFCFAIDDETTKLAIPTVFVRKTVGLQRMTPTPALCRLFMEGRCRQSSQCHQIHADVHVVKQLRREVLAAPPCCQMHTPHVVQTLAGCDLSWFVDVCGEAVPVALFCPTVGLRKCIDAHSTACAADLCRSHSSGALCRYGEDCNFLHVCPAMAEERFSAVAPSSRPRPYEERRVNSDSDSIKFRGSKEATTAPYHRRYHPNRVFRDPKSDQRELLMTPPHNAHNAAAMNSFLFHVVVPSPAASFMGAISDATTKATTTEEEEDSCPLPFACSGVFGEEDSLSNNDGDDGLLARNVKGDGVLFEEGGGLSMASSFCHGASNSLSSFYYSAASTNSPNKTCSTHHCVSPTCTTVIESRWSHNPYAKWFGETRTPCVCV